MRRLPHCLLVIALVPLIASGCAKDRETPEKQPSAKRPEDLGEKVIKGLDRLAKRHQDRQPTAPPRPQPQLSVTLDGKTVPFQAALAWTRPDGSLELVASSAPRACAEVTRDLVEYYPGEVMWSATFARQLKPDGTFGWTVRETHFSGMTGAGQALPVEITGEARPGGTLGAKLAFETSSAAFRGEAKKTLKVSGSLDAQGCEPKPAAAAATPLPAEQPAHLEVAGQKLALRGVALVQKDDERTLTLSTGPAACGSFVNTTGAAVTITLHYRKDKGEEAWQTDLNGDWIGGQKATQIYKEGRLTATPSRAEAGATTVAMKLAGTLDIMGYAVKLSGQVTAPVCPPQ
jgi:hypothetical protein